LGKNIHHFKFKFELFDIFLQEQCAASSWRDDAGEMFSREIATP
jgi:hypothetical protein